MKITMKSYFVLCLVFISIALASADLNDVKNAALKNLDALIDKIKTLADETSVEVGKREENLNIISQHEREFGDGIHGKTVFEIKKTAKSAYMMASLLGTSNEVFRCIEAREREGLTETDKVFSQQFLDPGRDYMIKSRDYQVKLIKAWKDDYYKALPQYGDIYKKAVSEIKKSNSESYINSVVKEFTRTTGQMADIITSIHPNMAKLHIQVLRSLDQLVMKFQQYSRARVDETGKSIQKCFPKFYQQETFVNAFLF